jgi:hypothetical protein
MGKIIVLYLESNNKMNWLYNNIEVSENLIPEDAVGFVYKITNLTNSKFYIGKKYFYHTSNVKLGKKELAALPVTRGRKSTTKQVIKESDWRSYWGSSKELLSDVKELGEDKFERVILSFHSSSKQLTYFEMMHHVRENVLFRTDSYNDNILAKFYRKDFE